MVENNKHAASSAKFIAEYLQDRCARATCTRHVTVPFRRIALEDGYLRSLDKLAKPPKALLSGYDSH